MHEILGNTYIYIITIAYIEYARFQPYGCGQRKKNSEYLG